MKLKKIRVENYRLLKDFTIDLENNLSLVIGKNNTGKTSLLSVLEKFLTDKSNFSINDFNIDEQKRIKKLDKKGVINIPDGFDFCIKLFLEIHYDDDSDLKNISSLILDLKSEDIVVLGFQYNLNSDLFGLLRNEYQSYKKENKSKSIIDFLKKSSSSKFFKMSVYTHEFLKKNKLGKTELIKDKKLVSKIINVQSIKAKREVNNSDTNRPDKTLSKLSSEYYESLENTPQEEETIKKLNKKLEDTDKKLDEEYPKIFKEVLDKVELFGGKKKGDSIIKVISTLQGKNILKENTSVVYEYAKNMLPEDYNGLGYLNLFSMIFDLEIKFREFRKEREIIEEQIPADINILFIEEPEAHTHPQMQHVFIKNITKILKQEQKGLDAKGKRIIKKSKFNLQTIVTTHSSHITSESDFDDIKYFLKVKNRNKVISKNLKELRIKYDKDPKQYLFLKQYLTLNRAELFFADKAILIEGDTERILMSSMMSKLDNEELFTEPLLSQNISIIEVGAHSHIFEKFIDFIGIKYLLLTDIDTYKLVINPKTKRKNRVSCPVDDVECVGTDNNAINHFLKGQTFENLKESNENFVIKKGDLCVAFQHRGNNYHARSFEDAFISLNRNFIKNHKESFRSIKNADFFDLEDEKLKTPYELANECIKKKTHFALDIIYHSDECFSNWKIPSYIEKGLLWLQK